MLRKAENAVQMIRDDQTHSIPDGSADRARLALIMGLPDWPAAIERIDSARRNVAREFEALVFGGREAPQSGEDSMNWLASDGGLEVVELGDEHLRHVNSQG